MDVALTPTLLGDAVSQAMKVAIQEASANEASLVVQPDAQARRST